MNKVQTASDIRPRFVCGPNLKIGSAGRSVSLLCGYAPDGRPSPALIALCQAMARHDIDVHVCLAVNPSVDTIKMTGLEQATTVAFRENCSYDFGVWSAQLAVLPGIWEAERIIFANDSALLVNDRAFSAMMDELRADNTEFIALTETYERSYHTQSYFFQFRGAALEDECVRGFWAGISPMLAKSDIINNYEMGLIRAVRQNMALRTRVLFGYHKLYPNIGAECIPEGNPTHVLWERLLMNNMPFIKAELLHSNPMHLPLENARITLLNTGADIDLIDRHLQEMDRTRGPVQKKAKKANIVLKRALGEKRFQRLHEWNRRRLSRRRKRRASKSQLDHYGPVERTLRFQAAPVPSAPLSVCVQLHLYYVEEAPEICRLLGNIPGPFTLLVSVQQSEDVAKWEEFFSDRLPTLNRCLVRRTVNRGRDVLPWVVLFKHEILQHDLFLHVHTKRSKHAGKLNSWNSYLFHHVLGSAGIVSDIYRLFTEQNDLGLVYPPYFKELEGQPGWGGNKSNVNKLLGRLQLPRFEGKCPDFPAGSFFWCRTAIITPLLKLDLQKGDFDEENGQIEGTQAHAIERLVGALGQLNGYKKICADTDTPYNGQ